MTYLIGELLLRLDFRGCSSQCGSMGRDKPGRNPVWLDEWQVPERIGRMLAAEAVAGELAGEAVVCHDGIPEDVSRDSGSAGLGLPSPPPYLEKSADFSRGVNFAVAGATALGQTSLADVDVTLPYTVSSLQVQLAWFKDHLAATCPSVPQECRKKLERTAFFVGEIGGNDYNFALLQNKPVDLVKALVPMVVNEIVDAIKILIGEGARKIVVPGNLPIGCLPSYLSVFGRSNGIDRDGCVGSLNDFARLHNDRLRQSLQLIGRQNPNLTIAYADYYAAFMEMIHNPSVYGFEKGSLLQACCGAGGAYNFDMNRMCGGEGVPVCAEPAKFISWDGVHLTQAAYHAMADHLFRHIEFLNRCKRNDS
ncbi:GDSL esterase/lipase At5g03980-like [Wolffia australiana]